MFNNKKTKFDPNMTDTLVGEGSRFEGRLKSEASIRIEGQITGDIDSNGDVTVGEKGIARSHIRARNVIIAGKVTGNVTASGKLTIKATGEIHGNLNVHELTIETGGIFQGSSRMGAVEALEEQPLRSVAETPGNVPAVAAADDSSAVLRTW